MLDWALAADAATKKGERMNALLLADEPRGIDLRLWVCRRSSSTGARAMHRALREIGRLLGGAFRHRRALVPRLPESPPAATTR